MTTIQRLDLHPGGVITATTLDMGGEPDGPAEVVYDPSRFSWENTLYYGSGGDPMWCPRGEAALRYIGQFEPTHRKSLFEYILRRSGQITLTMAAGGFLSHAPDEMIDDMSARPEAFLLETPFMRALAALLVGDGYGPVVGYWQRKAHGILAPRPLYQF